MALRKPGLQQDNLGMRREKIEISESILVRDQVNSSTNVQQSNLLILSLSDII